jgi:hypothetical protein
MWTVEEVAIVVLLLPDGILTQRGKEGRNKLVPGKEALNNEVRSGPWQDRRCLRATKI